MGTCYITPIYCDYIVALSYSCAIIDRIPNSHFSEKLAMSELAKLLDFDHQTQALAQVSGRLGWDQETMMASGSSEQRAIEMSALEGVLHARRSDGRVEEWLSNINLVLEDEVTQAKLREIQRSYQRAVKVPKHLAQEIARVTSMAQGIWATARAENNFLAFAPILEEVLSLKREEGQALAVNEDIYDTMLENYFPLLQLPIFLAPLK